MTQKRREFLGLLLVLGSGVGLLSLHVVHLFGGDQTLVTVLSGILIPMLLSLGLFMGGIWLWRTDLSGRSVLRVGAWCLVGSAVLGAGTVLVVIYQRARGTVLDETLFVVADAVSIGSIAGFVMGSTTPGSAVPGVP